MRLPWRLGRFHRAGPCRSRGPEGTDILIEPNPSKPASRSPCRHVDALGRPVPISPLAGEMSAQPTEGGEAADSGDAASPPSAPSGHPAGKGGDRAASSPTRHPGVTHTLCRHPDGGRDPGAHRRVRGLPGNEGRASSLGEPSAQEQPTASKHRRTWIPAFAGMTAVGGAPADEAPTGGAPTGGAPTGRAPTGASPRDGASTGASPNIRLAAAFAGAPVALGEHLCREEIEGRVDHQLARACLALWLGTHGGAR